MITNEIKNRNLFLNIFIFDANTNVTTDSGLSAEMKTYYEKRLIELAEPHLIHDQFGDKYPIPKGSGKTIEFRLYDSLPKALKPITEGVTPDGLKLNVTPKRATVEQYGAWISLSDVLELTAIDNNIVQATKKLASQAGRTLDTVTRDVINGGTSVLTAPKVSGSTVTEVASRKDLDDTALLTPDLIFKAKADLAAVNADPIDDCYVGIIHPYVAYDLMRNPEWIDVHKYAQPENIYKGEIGKLGGVRFVETSEAKIFAPAVISDGLNKLTVKTAINSSTTSVVVKEKLTAGTNLSIPVYIDGNENKITAITAAADSSTLTVETAITSLNANKLIFGTGGTKDGLAVFSTLIIGANAYGTTELEGGGLQHIFKPKGAGEDPLNQRSSCGWKATKVAERLVEQYMERIESCSSYSGTAKAN